MVSDMSKNEIQTELVKWTQTLQRIDQITMILRIVSDDLHQVLKDLQSSTRTQSVTTQTKAPNAGYPKPIFLRFPNEEAMLRKYEENEQSWKDEKCCEKPFPKHDKVRGEVFCMNCGTVIAKPTFGQPGRMGANWTRDPSRIY